MYQTRNGTYHSKLTTAHSSSESSNPSEILFTALGSWEIYKCFPPCGFVYNCLNLFPTYRRRFWEIYSWPGMGRNMCSSYQRFSLAHHKYTQPASASALCCSYANVKPSSLAHAEDIRRPGEQQLSIALSEAMRVDIPTLLALPERNHTRCGIRAVALDITADSVLATSAPCSFAPARL